MRFLSDFFQFPSINKIYVSEMLQLQNSEFKIAGGVK